MVTQPGSIERIHARQVLDSRGRPTVEVDVHCLGGFGRAIVPSGASTGKHEAKELRDGDLVRFEGQGVERAVANVNNVLSPHLIGMPVTEQAGIDYILIELDGTIDKSHLGANALLGVSLACAHAAAATKKKPLWRYLDTYGHAHLPMPMVNLISGGLHAGGNLEFQDFLLLPIGARSFSDALEMTIRVHRVLGRLLSKRGFEGVLVADEGGYGPRLESNEQAIEFIVDAIVESGLEPGTDAGIAIDVASSHFYRDGRYQLRQTSLDAVQMIELLEQWAQRFPILSIEDGLAEDDFTGWQTMTVQLGHRVQLIGDDLFVTNPKRLGQGIEQRLANSILIKPNQIGTLTETLDVMEKARKNGYRLVMSARSGETEDSTIADLAVATAVGQIKIGSVTRGERLAKYNQLLRIEEAMKDLCRKTYTGYPPLKTW
jgi:enolase